LYQFFCSHSFVFRVSAEVKKGSSLGYTVSREKNKNHFKNILGKRLNIQNEIIKRYNGTLKKLLKSKDK
jgi:hypothetical protein